jgi:hypothetical protein
MILDPGLRVWGEWPYVVRLCPWRSCLKTRRPYQRRGVTLLEHYRNQRLDELWLDHDLGPDDTIWPVRSGSAELHHRDQPTAPQ